MHMGQHQVQLKADFIIQVLIAGKVFGTPQQVASQGLHMQRICKHRYCAVTGKLPDIDHFRPKSTPGVNYALGFSLHADGSI